MSANDSMSRTDTSGLYSERRNVRYVRRTSEPRVPFVPWGLLPLLGLLGVLLYGCTSFANNTVEAAAERAAKEALIAADAPWASAEASGQWINLKGTPPSSAARIAAIEAVDARLSETPFGRKSPVTRVNDFFTAVQVPTADPVTPPPETPQANLPNPEWMFRVSDGILRLEGEVPDELTRTTIADTARSAIDPPRIVAVDNALLLSGQPAPEGYLNVALRGVNSVARCDRGVASFIGDYFSLSCELPTARASAVQALASAPLPLGRLGAIDILPNEAVASCEASMRSLLTNTKIEFASGSAQIQGSSSALLDSVADAARACPGRLRIEGHTDSTGSPEKNEVLSRERAEAVKAALVRRGINTDRLETEGFGARVPIAENTTFTGRARNRRIEIRVVRSSE